MNHLFVLAAFLFFAPNVFASDLTTAMACYKELDLEGRRAKMPFDVHESGAVVFGGVPVLNDRGNGLNYILAGGECYAVNRPSVCRNKSCLLEVRIPGLPVFNFTSSIDPDRLNVARFEKREVYERREDIRGGNVALPLVW
ncbi:MAG: hypothetical protein ABL958_16110, partial [Bdellovibrionia bacterium]